MQIGIIGCGHVSDQYFEGTALFDRVEVVACADLEIRRAEAKAAMHGIPRALSPEQLLGDQTVELVVNLTPPLHHASVSAEALRSGKHVWSEKPLATSLADARELVALADNTGLRLGCAPDTFLGGGLQTGLKLVSEGWIGEPTAAVAFVSEPGYEHFHPNVDFFYGSGGGPALDLGPYYITALVAALGPVTRVSGCARAPRARRVVVHGPRAGQPIDVQVPTHVTGALEFECGAIATVLMSWDLWATNLPYLEIYGSEGSLALPNPDEFGGMPRLRRAGADELRQPPPPPGSLEWTPIPLMARHDVGRGIGIAEMAQALVEGRPHRASADLALHVLEVLLGLADPAGGSVEVETRCAIPALIGPGI